MSCVPLAWIRSSRLSAPRTSSPEFELRRQIAEHQERVARINAWLDGLIAAGCPPWNDFGQNLPEVEAGWLPEEAWTPYELYDFEDGVRGRR